MTRQKKALIRKIDEIHGFIEADRTLGCGFAPAGFYEPLEQQVWDLYEQLAHLQNYSCAMEMMMDTRGCAAGCGIPFV